MCRNALDPSCAGRRRLSSANGFHEGAASSRAIWCRIKKASFRRFVAGLPVRARFHLRGSFWQRFPEYRHEPLPGVFVEESPGALRTLISADDLRGVADLEALETLLASRVDMLSTGSISW